MDKLIIVLAIIFILVNLAIFVNAKSNCQDGTLVTSAEPLHPYACIRDK